MKNIFEQIDDIFSDEYDRPSWANELLDEIKDLKKIINLQAQNISKASYKYQNKNNDYDLYQFINNFREDMKPNVSENHYPTFQYEGINYGINLKGHIYNKDDSISVSRDKAFKIYRYLYEHQQSVA